MQLFFKFLFFSAVTLGFSQPYKPLLDTNNQWNFTTCNFGCIIDTYYTNGDTIVNSLNYKILDGYHYQSRTFLLREEIANKKVFFTKVSPNSISEKILYDFSLLEGDIFTMNNPLSPFPATGGEFILDSIRSKPLLNNINFKHFYFSPLPSNSISNYNVVWIEGIGSKSLINAPGGNVDINGVGELTCFYKNQDLVYSQLQPNESCSFLNLNLEKNKLKFEEVKIYTLSEKNSFSFSNSEIIEKIELFDIFGKMLNFDFNNYKTNKLINLNFYPKGIYFITIFDKNYRKKTFKIIIE